MKYKFVHPYCFLLIVTLVVAGCKNQENPATTVQTPDPVLLKCWTHAFEEDGQDNTRIFRSCMNHTFPAARYRNTFTLKENWEVEYSVPAPNDAHTTENGKWTYDSGKKKLRIINKEGGEVADYEVLELTDDLLKVKE